MLGRFAALLRISEFEAGRRQEAFGSEAGERRGFMVDNRSVTAGTRRAIQRFLAGEALTEQDLLDIFPPGKRAAVLDKFAGAASK